MSTSKQIGNWYPVPRDQEVLFKSLPTPSPSPLTTASHPIPDSKLAKAVDEFAKSQLKSAQYNHSRRIYHYGLAILEASFPHWLTGEPAKDGAGGKDRGVIEVDKETWFCTCLLHDIGLAEAYHLTTKMSFELKGGIVAREFLLEHGAHEDQADSVCEAIILHQDVWIQSGNISLNGQMIILATLFDNAGKFAEYVHTDTIKAVCEAFPRQGWSEKFACAVESEMREKPWSHTTTFEKPDWRQEGKGSQFGDTARGNEVMRPYDQAE